MSVSVCTIILKKKNLPSATDGRMSGWMGDDFGGDTELNGFHFLTFYFSERKTHM